jgi:hypothetical protein
MCWGNIWNFKRILRNLRCVCQLITHSRNFLWISETVKMSSHRRDESASFRDIRRLNLEAPLTDDYFFQPLFRIKSCLSASWGPCRECSLWKKWNCRCVALQSQPDFSLLSPTFLSLMGFSTPSQASWASGDSGEKEGKHLFTAVGGKSWGDHPFPQALFCHSASLWILVPFVSTQSCTGRCYYSYFLVRKFNSGQGERAPKSVAHLGVLALSFLSCEALSKLLPFSVLLPHLQK